MASLSLQEKIQRVRRASAKAAAMTIYGIGIRGSGSAPTPRAALDRWLASIDSKPLPAITGHVLLSALRNPTWIEWAGYAACVMRRMGVRTTILYSRSQVSAAESQWLPSKWRFWPGMIAIPDITLIDIDTWADPSPTNCPGLDAAVNAIVFAAVAYDRHIEEQDIVDNPSTFGADVDALRARNLRAGNGLYELLKQERFDSFILMSGLVGETPGLLHAARESAQTTVCLEGWAWRAGHMIYNHNAPALEYNVKGWLEALGPWDAAKEREVDEYLKFVDGAKASDATWLENFYRVQRDSVSATLPGRVCAFVTAPGTLLLAAPNVVGDSSMLARERCFRGQRDWLEQLIAHVRARPQLRLVVRAHPAEQWVGPVKCTIRTGDLATRLAGNAPNVLVIGSEEPVNTFSLLPFASAGLVYLSSAGPEMTARGLPVIAAGRPKYEGLGIVDEPLDASSYFAAVDAVPSAPKRPSAARIVAAKRYLHLVFRGFSFSAQGTDFRAMSLDLDHPDSPAEHETFFRIIAGRQRGPDQGSAGPSTQPHAILSRI